jgi:hypothetical protein
MTLNFAPLKASLVIYSQNAICDILGRIGRL